MTKLEKIRAALATYLFAEGCACCRDQETSDTAKAQLARLLKVPKYRDGSGYNFLQFRIVPRRKVPHD